MRATLAKGRIRTRIRARSGRFRRPLDPGTVAERSDIDAISGLQQVRIGVGTLSARLPHGHPRRYLSAPRRPGMSVGEAFRGRGSHPTLDWNA